uniref:ATP synthase F0 subunit 8 n=1 Tax=Aporrectodea rosea TaxID=27389 RepID=A0A6G6D9G0_9ANNE|nr:ATP synthase F0 subunit 8 [Aporrectodea rosea]QIE13187.1 ATP synthase F0 subunit 8 [Aporrectodea rosea]
MPHLSPMSWILAIVSFWMSISVLASTFWWTENHSFLSKTKYNISSTEFSWKWS